MATAAEEKRNSTASKLRDSIRQLRRYLDGESFSERILLQKCEKVDRDREELIINHHVYVKRAALHLEDADVRDFIEDKIDNAVDIVDEANVIIEKMSQQSLNEAKGVNGELDAQKKSVELVSAKLEVQTCEMLLDDVVRQINLCIQKDEHAEKDINTIEVLLDEIQTREDDN